MNDWVDWYSEAEVYSEELEKLFPDAMDLLGTPEEVGSVSQLKENKQK